MSKPRKPAAPIINIPQQYADVLSELYGDDAAQIEAHMVMGGFSPAEIAEQIARLSQQQEASSKQ